MAENKLKCSPQPNTAVPDSILLRLEVEEEASILTVMKELQEDLRGFSSSYSQDNDSSEQTLEQTEEDKSLSLASLGQRQMRDIRIERYCSQGSGDISMTELPDNIPFFSGIPVVEVTRGVVHLFRDRSQPVEQRTSSVVCIISVPANIPLSDLLNFLAPVQATMQTLQVVRDSSPNQYMVLLRFKNKSSAEQFYSGFNGRRYNSMEKAVCQLVFASNIEVIKSSEGMSTRKGLTELPSCPVCLEKLDESVLTILCNHSFHTYCLTKWEDSTCPVCRYTQIPESVDDNVCHTCDSKEDLWICLVCGHIGCGRYHGGHAHNHFAITQHTFSMQLGSQRVWDYIGDNWVHRIVQNKSDGKLVEVSGTEWVSEDEKIDSLQLEYTYLLTSQLESQRLFFEEKIARVEQESQEEVRRLELRCRSTATEAEKLSEQLIDREKELKALEKRTTQLQSKVNKYSSELAEEKQLNKCLMGNQQQLKVKVDGMEDTTRRQLEQKDKEINDLQEQLRDLMFYLETQQKIAQAPEDTRQELQEGHLVVTQGSKENKASGGAGGGRRSRRGRQKQ